MPRAEPGIVGRMAATLRTDFDAFLYSSVGDDANGMPVTLAHAAGAPRRRSLGGGGGTRLLRDRIRDAETGLALEAMPNGPPPAADTVNIASRLIKLLHRAPPPAPAPTPAGRNSLLEPVAIKVVTQAKKIDPAIYFLIGLIVLMIGQWALTSGQDQPPMDTSISDSSRK